MRLKLTPMSMLAGLGRDGGSRRCGRRGERPVRSEPGTSLRRATTWLSGTRSPTASSRPSQRLDRRRSPATSILRRASAEALPEHPGRQLRLSRRVHSDVHPGGCPWLAEGGSCTTRSGIPAQGGPVLPAGSSRAGQSDHPDAVGQRPGSAVGERQACAEGDRVVRFAFQLDPAAASGRCADRGDHRDRSVEPRGRSTRAGPAALPLARRGDRTSGGGVARPCREHVRGVQRARERSRPESSALRTHLLVQGRSASDRRRVPRDGRRLHGCVGLRTRRLSTRSPRAWWRRTVRARSQGAAGRVSVFAGEPGSLVGVFQP